MSDFAGLRRNGTIYVDKTAWFYRLAADLGRKFCFLSRPRRFGKSLMITALREIFKGNRDLFDGLAISKTDWQWEKWPVIHFEFADVASSSLEAFDRDFGPIVKKRLADAGFDGYDEAKSPGYNFGNAIDSLSAANGGRGVVVLVDEYDAPVSHALDVPHDDGRLKVHQDVRLLVPQQHRRHFP